MSERERLLTAQKELMRALWGLGPVPEGFDAAGVAVEGKTLTNKRRHQAAKNKPALVRALGRRFPEHFASYTAVQPYPGNPCSDGAGFVRWFHARLGDEAVLERINWQVGCKALLAQSRHQLTPETKADLDVLRAFLDEIVKRRGPLALQEPRLRAALTLGSIQALGLDLDTEQLEVLRKELLSELEVRFEDDDPSTLREAALSALRLNLFVERLLARVLRPEQRARYLALVGDDPFLGQKIPGLELHAPSEEELVVALVGVWAKVFALGETSRPAIREVAVAYARQVTHACAAPVPPDGARRESIMTRIATLLHLQDEAEERLARVLEGDERVRVEKARGSVILEIVVPRPD